MSTFTHIMVGSSDIEASRRFYDPVLGALGFNNAPPGKSLFYMGPDGFAGGAFGVGVPRNGDPATFANGGTIGFRAKSREAVDAFHAAGCANGGSCEGPPGVREGAPGAPYGAYVRDPDGNKLCAFVMG